jgi:hypothetical protein
MFVGYLNYPSCYLAKVCLNAIRQHELTCAITLKALATTESCEVVFAVITSRYGVELTYKVVK